MKLIIDIPEKTYNCVRDNILFAQEIDSDVKLELTGAIVNGTPLCAEYYKNAIKIMKFLQIIDKYKAESEEV